MLGWGSIRMLNPDTLDRIKDELMYHGRREMPREAVGLICPNGVIIPLINEAEGNGQYLVSSNQLEVVMASEAGNYDLSDLIIYHTHPSGLLGPSEGDLRARRTPLLNELAHMVLAMPGGEPCYY